jgi:hypothetical protein
MPFEKQDGIAKHTISPELVASREEIFDILHNRIAQLLPVGLDKAFIPVKFDRLDVLASLLG